MMDDQLLLQSQDPGDTMVRKVKAEKEEDVFVKTEREEIPLQISPDLSTGASFSSSFTDSGDSIVRNVKTEEEEEICVRNKEEEIPLQINPDLIDTILGNIKTEEEEEGFVKKEEEIPLKISPVPPLCDITARRERSREVRCRRSPRSSHRRHWRTQEDNAGSPRADGRYLWNNLAAHAAVSPNGDGASQSSVFSEQAETEHSGPGAVTTEETDIVPSSPLSTQAAFVQLDTEYKKTLQTPQKRKREKKEKFSYEENNVLVHEVVSAWDVLFGVLAKQTPLARKNRIWASICQKVNAVGVLKRDVMTCKKRLDDIKRFLRRKMSEFHKYSKVTGGGSPQEPNLLQYHQLLLSVLHMEVMEGSPAEHLGPERRRAIETVTAVPLAVCPEGGHELEALFSDASGMVTIHLQEVTAVDIPAPSRAPTTTPTTSDQWSLRMQSVYRQEQAKLRRLLERHHREKMAELRRHHRVMEEQMRRHNAALSNLARQQLLHMPSTSAEMHTPDLDP